MSKRNIQKQWTISVAGQIARAIIIKNYVSKGHGMGFMLLPWIEAKNVDHIISTYAFLEV